MVDTLTPNLQLTNQTEGGNDNTWGTKADDNFELIDDKLGDTTSISTTGGTTTLTDDQQDVAAIKVSGTLVSNVEVVFDGRGGSWIVWNNTSGAFTVTFKVSGQTGVAVSQGVKTLIWCDGTDIRDGVSAFELLSDTSPQLGADLDANGFSIQFDDATGIEDDSGNEQLIFQKTASAVNHVEITNAAASGKPLIAAVGEDTNIGLDLRGKGTGGVVLVANNEGLAVFDTDASHFLTLKPGSNLTANRTLTITPGDADRTLTLSGNLTVSGAATLPAGTALVGANNLSDVADAATAFGNIKQAASDSATGVVEIADAAEVVAASSTTKPVTPGRQHLHPGMAKASGSGAAAGGALGAGFNVASIARNGAGDYTVTMTNAMASTSYGVLVSAADPDADSPVIVNYEITSATVFEVYIKTRGSGAAADADFTFAVFGEAA